MSNARSTLVLLTETYSVLGGLQRFNRRLVDALLATPAAGAVQVMTLRDKAADIPASLRQAVAAVPTRSAMLGALLKAVRGTDLLILGHINLLPLALAAKVRRPRLRILLIVHGLEVWDLAPYRRKKRFEPTMLRLVDRIASVSDFTARTMANAFKVPDQRLTLLPNAVDLKPAVAAAERQPIVLTVTRLAPHDRGKNVDKVLQAFALVLTTQPDARLEIIGDGPLRPELETLASELRLGNAARFLGRVDDAALASAYHRAALFALPSAKEGFGIVFLEAWMHGLPVICGTQDAAQEIISEGVDGFAVDPSNISMLADRMATLLADPQRAQSMAAAGARKVADLYSDDRFRQNLQRVLGEVLP